MKYNFVYVTAKNAEEAEKIGRSLVEEHLAACVNIMPGMCSIYWWGGIQQETEAILIAKTKAPLVDEVIAKIKSMHSYECPAIVALPIIAGNAEYLDWIGHETREMDEAASEQSDPDTI